MERSRRRFLKVGGTCILGLSTIPALKAVAVTGTPGYSQNPEALAGERWALVIDMVKCLERQQKEPCKDCMLACNRVHNVPNMENNPKEEIKWIWTENFEHAFPYQAHEYTAEQYAGKPFIVLCNHCANPPCCRVCPTKATFQREDGVVMMDYHRCIGCRFCMAACPYGSRSFNFRDPRPFVPEPNMAFPTREKGVVEKCNFCAERLAVGQLPACVEACKEKALVFGDLADPESDVSKVLRARYTIRRKNDLGTLPHIFYIV